MQVSLFIRRNKIDMSRTVRVLMTAEEVTEAFIRYACLVKGIDRDRVTEGESFIVIVGDSINKEVGQVRVDLEVSE